MGICHLRFQDHDYAASSGSNVADKLVSADNFPIIPGLSERAFLSCNYSRCSTLSAKLMVPWWSRSHHFAALSTQSNYRRSFITFQWAWYPTTSSYRLSSTFLRIDCLQLTLGMIKESQISLTGLTFHALMVSRHLIFETIRIKLLGLCSLKLVLEELLGAICL